MKIIVSEGQSVFDSTGKIRRGGMTAEVPDDFLVRNPRAGVPAEMEAAKSAPEVAPSPLVTELPVEGEIGAFGAPSNGPLVEKLVTEKPAKAKKPRGRRPKAKS